MTVVKAFTASSGEMLASGSTKCTISSFSGRSRMEEYTGSRSEVGLLPPLWWMSFTVLSSTRITA